MILCLGTTPTMQRTMIFDRLKIDEVNRAIQVSEYSSGKSINVAKVVRALAENAAVIGFAGGDRGKALRAGVIAEGIEDLLVESAAQTRLCTTIVDRAQNTATELIEESKPVEPQAWSELDQALDRSAPRAKVIVCSGTLAPGGSRDLYARVAQRKLPGQHVIIDARADLVTNALKHPGFILKLNQEELFSTVGMEGEAPLEGEAPAEPSRKALSNLLQSAMPQALPRDGAVIVTMGKSGACAFDGTTFYRVQIPSVNVISPIGSGDSFAAGVAVALSRKQSFQDALRLGAACGCANAMTPRAGEVHLKDVEALSSQIKIETLQ